MHWPVQHQGESKSNHIPDFIIKDLSDLKYVCWNLIWLVWPITVTIHQCRDLLRCPTVPCAALNWLKGLYNFAGFMPLLPPGSVYQEICNQKELKPTLIARFIEPTWGPSWVDRAQVGPRLAPWTLLSGCWQCIEISFRISTTNVILR